MRSLPRYIRHLSLPLATIIPLIAWAGSPSGGAIPPSDATPAPATATHPAPATSAAPTAEAPSPSPTPTPLPSVSSPSATPPPPTHKPSRLTVADLLQSAAAHPALPPPKPHSLLSRPTMKGAIPEFIGLEELPAARRDHPALPVVVCFYNDEVQACQSQITQLQSDEFHELTPVAIFVRVQVTQSPDVARDMKVVRVPAWLFLGPDGRERSRKSGALTPVEISDQLVAAKTPT